MPQSLFFVWRLLTSYMLTTEEKKKTTDKPSANILHMNYVSNYHYFWDFHYTNLEINRCESPNQSWLFSVQSKRMQAI